MTTILTGGTGISARPVAPQPASDETGRDACPTIFCITLTAFRPGPAHLFRRSSSHAVAEHFRPGASVSLSIHMDASIFSGLSKVRFLK